MRFPGVAIIDLNDEVVLRAGTLSISQLPSDVQLGDTGVIFGHIRIPGSITSVVLNDHSILITLSNNRGELRCAKSGSEWTLAGDRRPIPRSGFKNRCQVGIGRPSQIRLIF